MLPKQLDVAKATWKKLEGCKFADKSSKNFVNSGNIDLSAYNGVVYIAFKYTGNNSDKSGTFQIDNVKFNYTAGADNGGNNNNTAKVVETLNENFDSVQAPAKGEKKQYPIELEGWTNVKEEGDRVWIGKEFSKNKYAQISGYKSKSSNLVAWLVTPGLDLSKATNKNFSFDSQRQHSRKETLEVLISTDFKGDVTKATWNKLEGYVLADFADPSKDATKYGKVKNSGNIDLSAYSGVVYIAFKYVGNNSDKSGTFQIDNVKFNYTASTDNGGNNNGGNSGDNGNGGDNNSSVKALFSGADFEDWEAFKSSLNKYGVQKYGTQSNEGRNNSKALHIKTEVGKDPKKNSFVFTANVPENFDPKGKTKISFYIKGTCPSKSLSFNVYKEKANSKGFQEYYRFNLGKCESDKTLKKASSNQYSGSVDTKGKWVKITLDIAGLDGLATSNGKSFFGFKIGIDKKKGSDWDLLVDDITIE